MDTKLSAACRGLSLSQGGLNKEQLIKLAEEKGHADAARLTRAKLLDILCIRAPAPAPAPVLVLVPAPVLVPVPAVMHQKAERSKGLIASLAGLVGRKTAPVGRKVAIKISAPAPIIAVPPIKTKLPTIVQGGQVVQVGQLIQSKQVGQKPQPAEVESVKFAQACMGKIRSEGGLDTEQLQALAEKRGIADNAKMTRLELLHVMCPPLAASAKIRIDYKPVAEFLRLYPLGTLLGSGTYGSVYKSDIHAIKKFDFSEAITELNTYASVYHPCINRPVAWSYDPSDEKAYVAMPLGLKIVDAYRARLITIEQIISDTLSAIAYMNKLGFVHRDIKPDNIIFQDGHAKIIDMGLSDSAMLFSDGEYRFKGVAYTASHKDPEYIEELWNSSNAETYALVKSYYDILGHDWSYDNMYSFKPTDPVKPGFPPVTNVPALTWLFTEAQKPADSRPTTFELLEAAPAALIVRRHVGTELDTPSVSFSERCSVVAPAGWDINQTMIAILDDWLLEVAAKWNLSAKVFFAGLHLINRTVHVVKTKRTDLQALGCMCIHLASIVTGESRELSEWRFITDKAYTSTQFEDMMVKILAAADCIVVGHTPWDYASCEEDLIPMLDDMVKCDYDPTHTRALLNTGNTKSIGSRKLKVLWNAAGGKLDTLKSTLMDRIPYVAASNMHPITDVVDPITIDLIMRKWKPLIDSFRANSTDKSIPIKDATLGHIGLLIRGKHLLRTIPTTEIYRVYALLRGEKLTYASAFSRIFDYDFNKYSVSEMSARGLNPFTVTQAELDTAFGSRP